MKVLLPATLCATFLLSGCGGGSSGTQSPPSSGNVTVGPVTGPNHLQIGVKSATFVYSATVSGSSNTAVTWSVDDSSIATIDTNTGIATPSANKTGSVTFTATAQADPSSKSTVKVQVVDWLLTGALDVTVINADGSTPIELLPSSERLGDCSWTPDHLGFVCLYYDPNTAVATQLLLFKTDGTPAKTTQTAMLDLKALGGLIYLINPSFSPDGKKIAFYGLGPPFGNAVGGTFVVGSDGSSAPLLLDIDPNAFGNSGFPRFTADGKSILYTHDFGLWSMNVDGSNQQRILTDGMNAILSPDLSTLYYTSNELTVYRANPDGTNPIAIGLPGDELLGLSPNGQAIVVMNQLFPTFGTYIENSDGTGRRQIAGMGSASW